MSRLGSLTLLAVVAAVAFGGSPVLAGGSLKDDGPAPATYDWNGLSVGIGIGASTFRTDVWAKGLQETYEKFCWPKKPSMDTTESSLSILSESEETKYKCKSREYDRHLKAQASEETWEWFGTVRLGYDRLLHQRILVGAFADFDFYNDAEHTFHVDKRRVGSLSGVLEREHIWTLGGRAGYLLRPNVALYALAGYSQMKLSGSLDLDFADRKRMHAAMTTPTSFIIDKSLDGYTLGAGVEVKIDKRLSLQFEYRYMKFDGFTASGSQTSHDKGTFGCNSPCGYYYKKVTESGKITVDDMDEHSVRAVLVFKLGEDRHVGHAPLK